MLGFPHSNCSKHTVRGPFCQKPQNGFFRVWGKRNATILNPWSYHLFCSWKASSIKILSWWELKTGRLMIFWWFRLLHNDSVWQILVLYWQNSTKCFSKAKQAGSASERISKQCAAAFCNLFLIITDNINGRPCYLLRFPLGIRRETRQRNLQCSCWAAGAAGRALEQAGTWGSVFVTRATWSVGPLWRDICGVGSLQSSFNLVLSPHSRVLGSVGAAQMKM